MTKLQITKHRKLWIKYKIEWWAVKFCKIEDSFTIVDEDLVFKIQYLSTQNLRFESNQLI